MSAISHPESPQNKFASRAGRLARSFKVAASAVGSLGWSANLLGKFVQAPCGNRSRYLGVVAQSSLTQCQLLVQLRAVDRSVAGSDRPRGGQRINGRKLSIPVFTTRKSSRSIPKALVKAVGPVTAKSSLILPQFPTTKKVVIDILHKSATTLNLKRTQPAAIAPTPVSALPEIVKSIKSRSDDIRLLTNLLDQLPDTSVPELRDDDSLVNRIDHKEKARTQSEGKLLAQLDREELPAEKDAKKLASLLDYLFRRALIRLVKKTLKAFETRSGRPEPPAAADTQNSFALTVEQQVNSIMLDRPPAKLLKENEFSQCQSLRRVLCCAFREPRLDIGFIIRFVVVYSRCELQKAVQKAAGFLASTASSGIKRQFYVRQVLATKNSGRDCNRQYMVHAKEKLYKVMLRNNTDVKGGIDQYAEDYRGRHEKK